MTNTERHPASFRDPSGFVFKKNNEIFRKINPIYFRQYDRFMKSGLYEELSHKKLIIDHNEDYRNDKEIIIKPRHIDFISYPCEWSFEQLRDAALLTLNIQKIALKYDFLLKDATAYNVTFHNGRPCFIDTLSFDFYKNGAPWNAYGQFISHFLSPLLLSK